MLKPILLATSLMLTLPGVAQKIKIGNILKSKASQAKEKVIEKANESWENMSKEYDESNFNYAISFLDNSSVFEAEEKGSSFASTLLLGSKMKNKYERSKEDIAYTNLKNGEMLMAGHKFFLAERSLMVAKVLYEDDGKTFTTNYAQAVSDLGLLYQSTGRFVKAKTFDEQAIKLRETLNNKGMMIVSINNYAVLQKETGFYVEAETGFKKALTITNDEQDQQLANALIHNNLAMAYLDMNKLDDAETEMNSSLKEAGSILPVDAGNYIKLQINLANVYRFEKKYNQAEELYLKAMDQKEKKLGKHPDLAHLQKGLAQLYMEMGKTDKVEDLLKSAYDIDQKKLGDKDPATLAVQQELANFYRFNNQPAKSLELLTRVVETKKILYGENHPNYLQALEDLALTQWQSGNFQGTKENYQKVIANTLYFINTFFNSLNENEKTLYWEKTNARLQRFYSFANAQYTADPSLVDQFFNVVLNTKGFLLNSSVKIRNTIYNSSDDALKTTYGQWLETKESLNQAYQLTKDELAEEKVNLDSLKARADELERELSQKSAIFKSGYQVQAVSLQDIQHELQPGEAAAEIVALNSYENGFTGNGRYVALVLTSSGSKLIDIGDGALIQKAIGEYRKKVTRQLPENEAYAVVWKPVDEELKGISKLYLSVDGDYHQLSVNGLKDGSGKYVVDKYAIQFEGNTRDILEIKQNQKALIKPGSAFLVGNPAFGKNAGVSNLPGTADEVKNIGKILTDYKVATTTLVGANATEAKLKEVNSPGILHIATHGYFFADLNKVRSQKVLGEDISAAKENPLLRSGILLANCENVFDKKYRPEGNNENGVLTAYEAMGLNLDKTELVILSACETGLGTIKQGEGVYGLQRAFLISGAKCIIMSLWKVNDLATREMMTNFYSNYTKTGDKQQAFLEALKQAKTKYKDPYYWGGFVLLSK